MRRRRRKRPPVALSRRPQVPSGWPNRSYGKPLRILVPISHAYGVAGMASPDDRPLETSLRILLTSAGRDRNTGQRLAMNPTNDKPLLLKFKQGKNVLRLTNLNGRGVNVDYLALTSPDVKVTRELLAAKVKK